MLKKSKFTAAFVAAAMALTSLPAATSALASPIAPLPKVTTQSFAGLADVVEVGHKRKYKKSKHKKYKGKRHYKRYSKHRKHKKRKYHGFDAGSFVAGTLLGVIITQPGTRYVYDQRSLPKVHVHYCKNRYKSYRLWDNSWQPYHGPRKFCRSPYFR